MPDDRGIDHLQFSLHAGAKFYPRQRLKFDERGLVGKHRHLKPQHFHHFGHSRLLIKLGAAACSLDSTSQA